MKFFISGIALIVAIGIMIFFVRKDSPKIESQKNTSEDHSVEVTVKPVRDLTTLVTEENLPCIIVSENEVILVAETNGTISSLQDNLNVGKKISAGEILAQIDNPEKSVLSKSGLRSEMVKQAEIAVSLAKKSYLEAKRIAKKNSSKENSFSRDIAKLRLESAEVNLANVIDTSVVRSPISGIVSEKNISDGSSVSPGTVLFRIVSGNTMKARFHVSETTRQSLKIGEKVQILLQDTNKIESIIVSIGTVADPNTGKFPIEANLKENSVASGTVANALIETTQSSQEKSGIFLPLSAITIGQSDSFFFIAENNRAKKIPVVSMTISGEFAFVSADIPNDTNIILQNTAPLEEGTIINIK